MLSLQLVELRADILFEIPRMFRRFSKPNSFVTIAICLIASLGALMFSSSESHEQTEGRAETVLKVEFGELCSTPESKRRRKRSGTVTHFTFNVPVDGTKISVSADERFELRSTERDNLNGHGTRLII